MLAGARLLLLFVEVASGALRWQRALLPCLIFLGLAALFVGSQWRWLAKVVAAIAEAIILAVIIYGFRQRHGSDQRPLEMRVLEIAGLFLPEMAARTFTGEMILLRSAWLGVTRRVSQMTPEGFGYVQGSLLPVLPLIVLLGSPADLFLIREILRIKSPIWTAILTLLDLWAVAWLYGLVVTMRLRPHQLIGGQLHVHKGFLAWATIDLSTIKSMTVIGPGVEIKAHRPPLHNADLSIPGGPKVEFELTRPVTVEHWFARRPRAATNIWISVEDAQGLCSAIKHADHACNEVNTEIPGSP